MPKMGKFYVIFGATPTCQWEVLFGLVQPHRYSGGTRQLPV